MMKVKYALAALAIVVATPSHAETLTNRSIIALSASGVGDEVIIAKIRSSDTRFDLSTDQIIYLRKQGVSGPVIAAMMAASSPAKESANAPERPTSPTASAPERPASGGVLAVARPAGIYLLSGGQLVRIDFNVSGQTRTGGMLGMALTGGIAAMSVKATIQGEHARVATSDRTPTFYFYLPDAANHANLSSFEAQSTNPTSPNEFSLVRLNQKKGYREARVGRANIGGMRSGVMDKDRIDFRYEEVRPGVFSVKPTNPIEPGEYSFVMIGAGGAKLARFFDFSVQ
jgi:hypothetical protein